MDQGIDGKVSLLGRNKGSLNRLCIVPLKKGGNRLGIGGRTADTILLPEFDDLAFIIAARGLRKVLLLIPLPLGEDIPFLNGGGNLAFGLLILLFVFVIDTGVAVKESLGVAAVKSVAVSVKGKGGQRIDLGRP